MFYILAGKCDILINNGKLYDMITDCYFEHIYIRDRFYVASMAAQ